MIREFLLRWLANGIGLWIAARLISGIGYNDSIGVIVVAALVFSIVNALVRPLIVLFSLPAIIITLGLFMLVVNAFMLYLVTVIYPRFTVDSFTATVLAVMVVWLVNYTLSTLAQGNYSQRST